MAEPLLAPRERLTYAIDHGAPHYRPIFRAVRDHDCTYAMVPQNAGRFDIAGPRPTILVIGDDMAEALGPTAFHRKSLKRYVTSCAAAVVVSSEPLPVAYGTVAMVAMLRRRNVVLVETLPRFEADWVNLLNSIKSDVVRLISTVGPEGSVH